MEKKKEHPAGEEASDSGAADAPGEPFTVRERLTHHIVCLEASVGTGKDIMGIAEKEAGYELPRTRAALGNWVASNVQVAAFLREEVVDLLPGPKDKVAEDLFLGRDPQLCAPVRVRLKVDSCKPAIVKGKEVVAWQFGMAAACHDESIGPGELEWRFSFRDRTTGDLLVYVGAGMDDAYREIVVRDGGQVAVECRRVWYPSDEQRLPSLLPKEMWSKWSPPVWFSATTYWRWDRAGGKGLFWVDNWHD